MIWYQRWLNETSPGMSEENGRRGEEPAGFLLSIFHICRAEDASMLLSSPISLTKRLCTGCLRLVKTSETGFTRHLEKYNT